MIITLSRQLGSGGDMVAARVAAALGLLLLDREYIRSAATAENVRPSPSSTALRPVAFCQRVTITSA